jgi:hypothetical protein
VKRRKRAKRTRGGGGGKIEIPNLKKQFIYVYIISSLRSSHARLLDLQSFRNSPG